MRYEVKSNPEGAAQDYDAIVSKGLLDLELVKLALKETVPHFTANPHLLIEPTKKSVELLIELGVFAEDTDMSNLFSTSLYDRAITLQ